MRKSVQTFDFAIKHRFLEEIIIKFEFKALNSTNFINDEKFIQQKFSWQEGFGAFSCGQSQLNDIYQYILGQEQHHSGQTFKDEYKGLLNDYNIDHDEKYLFDWIL